MDSICVPALRPSPSCSKERLGIHQLVSFTLKTSHLRVFISILLLAFRACCLKCLCVPFSSSLFYPRDLLVLLREVVEERHRGGEDARHLGGLRRSALATGFRVVPSQLSTVSLVWGETSWSPCSLLSPRRG